MRTNDRPVFPMLILLIVSIMVAGCQRWDDFIFINTDGPGEVIHESDYALELHSSASETGDKMPTQALDITILKEAAEEKWRFKDYKRKAGTKHSRKGNN